ncbi:MAG: peptidylprolyl isomerase [Clostridia bacterium]|nr:peptidylprolyl isomerase [Clostridia bacterium]
MTKKIALLMGCILLLTALTACSPKNSAEPPYADAPDMDSLVADPDAYAEEAYGFQLDMPEEGETVAIMHTSKGDISIRFFPEAAPKTVQNFIMHAQKGYFDGLTFHRVINDFMIQGGDPEGNGTGGESIWGKKFEDEFNDKLFNLRGSLAMANSGVNTNGSQFFINQGGPTGATAAELKEAYEKNNAQTEQQVDLYYDQYVQYYGQQFTAQYPTKEAFLRENLTPAAELVPDEVWELYAKHGGNIHLDGACRYVGGHTVFGQVYEGMDVVDAIAAVETDDNNLPTKSVIIKSVEITTYQG